MARRYGGYTIRFNETEMRELEEKADELGVSRATVIRMLIKKYMKSL